MKKNNFFSLTLLGSSFIIAIVFKFMLGIALIGLFLRPVLKKLPFMIYLTFIVAAFLLGSSLSITSTNILYGITLGIAAFTAQIVATFLVAPRLQKTDKLFLAFAQYNGITAIILALIIATWIPETVSIIAVGIVTINLLYYASNWLLERKFR